MEGFNEKVFRELVEKSAEENIQESTKESLEKAFEEDGFEFKICCRSCERTFGYDTKDFMSIVFLDLERKLRWWRSCIDCQIELPTECRCHACLIALDSSTMVPINIKRKSERNRVVRIYCSEECHSSDTFTTRGPSLSEQRLMCATCHEKSLKLKRCKRCKRTKYCSVACQRAHWKFHKFACTSMAKE